MNDTRVPGRIRRTLNVESGLNDGIATPFVNLFLAAAVVGTFGGDHGVRSIVWELAGGAAIGTAVGLGGAIIVRAARVRGWSSASPPAQAVLGLAVLAYAAALTTHANGFVAAFVAGLALGSLGDRSEAASLHLSEDLGQILSLAVWFLFGAVLIVPAVQHATWNDLVFAVLALTAVRMVPVAFATIGAGLDRTTIAFIGWFGPRGLASVVFTLIAVDSMNESDGNRVLATATLTVLLSVIAHGITASPLASRYSRHVDGLSRRSPEHLHAPTLRTRSLWHRPHHHESR